MKIILSRKGFDSAYGGYPSPILPDGKMISLPIPSEGSLKYSDLGAKEGLTYYELMKQLYPRIKIDDDWHQIDEENSCHLDPDIYKNAIGRMPSWKPCFGQIDSAQSHLENQGIREGDLFLFFGWFRKTRFQNGKLKFIPREKGMHAIYGYLQIGEIVGVDQRFAVPDWMAYHPHADDSRRSNESNTIYVARPDLSWDESLPGAGSFELKRDLVLTKKGLTRSKWYLPDCFREADISYHSKDSWKDGYFQSAMIGQEFVINDNEKVEEWARNLIEGAKINQ